ncbi:MAG: trimethylamine methyltransferase family protein [Ruthenibacterium sp.]
MKLTNLPLLQYATQSQIEELHQYSVRILNELGMQVEDAEIRTLLCNNGCTQKGDRVFFSADLIATMLQSLKQEVTMYAAATGEPTVLSLGTTSTHSTGGVPWIVDMTSGKRRNGQLSDLIDAIHVMNQLPELDIPCALIYPSDIPSEITQLKQTATMLAHCSKPIYGPGVSQANNAKYIAELFQAYGGETLAQKPIGMVGISPQSPLGLPKEITDTMKYIIGAGIPTSILAAPMGGLTAPLSVTGTVAQAHAEILGFACVAYLINPDCVLFYGARTFFANMKSAQSILGLPETGISSALAVQLATHCGFMTDVNGLACTSCDMDEQAGYEKMMNALLPAMAGATLITGIGSLASVMCTSLGQLVLDNEMMAMVRKAQKALSFDPDEMGWDAIECVVQDDDTFLVQDHTIEHLHDEVFETDIGFDGVWADWVSSNEVPLAVRAKERACDLILRDQELHAKPSVQEKVDAIMAKAQQELCPSQQDNLL